jgi:hypothetical protein
VFGVSLPNGVNVPIFGVRLIAAVVLGHALAGCGDKVPESAAARQAGTAPKQAVDKVLQDTGKALQQGGDRARDADEGTR